MTSAMCSGQVTFTLCGQGLQMLEGTLKSNEQPVSLDELWFKKG